MKWQCADRAMKTEYSFEVGTKADLIIKMEIGNEVFPAFIVGIAQWKSESLKLCPRPLMKRNSLKGTFPRHVGE
ncbi:hypothetical protein DHD05_18275 [Arenibacter sp. N53]|nr:hypothetical protein [Arenibacter sp. N53]